MMMKCKVRKKSFVHCRNCVKMSSLLNKYNKVKFFFCAYEKTRNFYVYKMFMIKYSLKVLGKMLCCYT